MKILKVEKYSIILIVISAINNYLFYFYLYNALFGRNVNYLFDSILGLNYQESATIIAILFYLFNICISIYLIYNFKKFQNWIVKVVSVAIILIAIYCVSLLLFAIFLSTGERPWLNFG